MHIPSLPLIVKDLNSNVQDVQSTLSIFVLSFAFFQLIYGPISDKYGRKKPLIFGMLIYLTGSILAYTASSVGDLILARTLQGIGSCAGYILSMAIVKDIYEESKAASMLSYLTGSSTFVPALGTLAGGYIVTFFDWRFNFLIFSIFGVICFLGVLFVLKETNNNKTDLALSSYFKSYFSIIQNKNFFGYLSLNSLIYGAAFAYVSGCSFLLIGKLNLEPKYFGFSYMVTLSGLIVGGIISGKIVSKLGMEKTILTGIY